MIYILLILIVTVFVIASLFIDKYLLKMIDPIKFLGITIIYVIAIISIFHLIEILLNKFYSSFSQYQLVFTLVYLLCTMLAFLNIAIISIKKLRKK